ncbi:MAG: CDGSH iron-sulfur domain-containing protein [Actinomycetota bacterium]
MQQIASDDLIAPAADEGCLVARIGGCAVIGDPEVFTVRRYPDGPALVRGATHLIDRAGQVVACGRRTVAICVCGASRLGSLCDGTHRFVSGPRATPSDQGCATTSPTTRVP